MNAQEDYDSSLMTRAQADDILQEMLYADSRSSMQVNSILRQLKQLMLDKSGEEDYQGLEEDSSELASAEKRAIRALMRGNGKPDLGQGMASRVCSYCQCGRNRAGAGLSPPATRLLYVLP